MPGPPLPAFAGRNPVAQARGAGDSFQVDPGRLGLVSGGGRPLPEAVRSQMETALGADFSAVRVHVGPQAERIGAVAFTVGNDLYFAPGRFQPDTIHGKQLLGHELAHVVQQRQGRVRNSMGTGVAVVRDTALEAEADRLGSRAAAYRVAVQPKLAQGAARPSAAVRVSPLRSAGSGGDTLIAGTRGRRVGSHTARPAHAADPANISHRLLAQRKAQDLASSSRPFKQLSARQRNTKENAQIIQLHEKSCRFVVCTPKRVTTTT
jgi:hypothetical protein